MPISRLLKRFRKPGDPPPAAHAEGATASRPGTVDVYELRRRFLQLVCGNAPPPEAPCEAHEHALEKAAARFDPARLPRLPELLPQVLAAMRRETTDTPALAALVAQDPVLAGEVIRVANSAYYARGKPVSSLEGAIRMLGHDGLRRAALAVLMRPIVRTVGGEDTIGEEQLWLQAQRCMSASSRLPAPHIDPAELQLAAVISTTGLGAVLRRAPREAVLAAGTSPALAAHCVSLGWRLSARAAEHWQFPEAVQDAMRACAESDPGASELGRALLTADRLAMAAALVDAGALDTAAAARIELPLPLASGLSLGIVSQLRKEFGDA